MHHLRHIGYFLLILCSLSACCDTSLSQQGTITDATTSQPMDSVHISLIWAKKHQVQEVILETDTDSLGRYEMEGEAQACKGRYFLLATKPGFRSQTFDVAEIDQQDLTLLPD